MCINRSNSTLPTRLTPGHLPLRGGFERNPFVGCGLLDAPPKIGTIFGFSAGKYLNCLRQCDFALQNHRRVRDAAPYDFCRNVCDKLQFEHIFWYIYITHRGESQVSFGHNRKMPCN